MTSPRAHLRRRIMAAATIAVASVGLFACSTSNVEDADTKTGLSVPQATLGSRAHGDECDDPTGDMLDDPKAPATLSQPAGIDLVHAEAKQVGDNLEVVFQTNGPIDAVANPLFLLQQGDISRAINQSFELRAKPDAAGTWNVNLITFANNVEQLPKTLPAQVVVDGNRLSYSVPMKSLPTIATILWQFGSSGGASSNNRVIDDCEPFTQQAGTAGSTPRTSATTPSPTVASKTGAVGQQIVADDGTKVTVKTVDVPAKPTHQPRAEPLPDNQIIAVLAEVCAGPKGLDKVGDFEFTAETSDGQTFDPWAADDYTNEPRFTIQSSLRSNECTSGWINYDVPKAVPLTSITFDVGGRKVGPYIIVKVG